MTTRKNITVADFGKVAVLMGGTSAEREISLLTGQAVVAALQHSGVDTHAVDAADNVLQNLLDGNYSRAFIALHGRGGEDGVIQGALETMGLPYTGCGVLGAALSMDKLRCKQLWQGTGLPTPAWRVLATREDAMAAKALGLPLMIKPAHEGSSIGMTKVESAGQLVPAWELAREYDDCVLAESFIDGAEYTVSILHNEALPVIRLETDRDFYDYEAKYEADDTRYICPCGLQPEAEAAMQQLSMQAFTAAAVQGWGRVDLMRDSKGNNWLIEVNSVPGLTDHSLVPMAAQHAGLNFEELSLQILATSMHKGGGV